MERPLPGRKHRYALVFILSVLLSQAVALGGCRGPYGENAGSFPSILMEDVVPSCPITISSDHDLLEQAGSNRWPGNGSQGAPVVIEGLTINGSVLGYGILLRNTTLYFIIRNCRVENITEIQCGEWCYSGAIAVCNATNGRIEECHLENNEAALVVTRSCEIVIKGNHCGDRSSICQCRDLDIDGNRLQDGMWVLKTVNSTIRRNIYLGERYGLLMDECSSCQIIGNDFHRQRYHSLYLGVLDASRIDRNNLIRCTGIEACAVSRSTFSENLLFNAPIHFMKCSYWNQIWGNAFVTNCEGTLACQEIARNNWNSSLHPMGNHWSTWTRPDDNGDGIVDIPYRIPGSSYAVDNYPLTTPSFQILSAPCITRTVFGNGFVHLEWDSPGIRRIPLSCYRIYRAEGEGGYVSVQEVQAGTTSFTHGPIRNGRSYRYRVAGVNDLGGEKWSDPVHALPEGPSPMITIIDPEPDSVLNRSRISFEWRIEGITIGVDRCEIRLDSGDWIPTTERCYNVSLGEGIHFFEVYVEDKVGNNNTTSVAFTVDVTRPGVEILSPEQDSLFPVGSVRLDWEGQDEVSGIQRFELSLDGGFYVDHGGNKNYIYWKLSDGLHTVSIRVWDMAGNWNRTDVDFTVDTTPPEIEIIQPGGHRYIPVDYLKVEWSGSDAVSGIERYRVGFEDYDWVEYSSGRSVVIGDLGEGPHRFRVQAVDRAGHSSEAVLEFHIDLTVPGLIMVKPEAGALLNHSFLDVEWIGWDNSSMIDHYEFRLDDRPFENLGTATRTMLTDLSEGKHKVKIVAYDKCLRSAAETVEFSVDTVPPSVLDCLPRGDEIPVDTVVRLRLSEAVEEGSLDVWMDGVEGRLQSDRVSAMFIPDSNLSYGVTYAVHAKGCDPAGNPLIPYQWRFTTTDIGSVGGRVLDGEGIPVDDVAVYIGPDEGARTDGNGNFTIKIRPGSYNISFHKEDHHDAYLEFALEPGENLHIGNVTLLREVEEVIEEAGALPYVILVGGVLAVVAGIVSWFQFVLRRRYSRSVIKDMEPPEIKGLKEEISRDIGDPMNENCYQILGIDRNATPVDIKKAYWRLADLNHPDKLQGIYGRSFGVYEGRMRRINSAKDILMHPEKRAVHDSML